MLSIANPGRASITAKKITVSTASTAMPWQAVDRPRTFSASLTPCPRVPHHFPTPLAAAADAAVAVIANLYLLARVHGSSRRHRASQHYIRHAVVRLGARLDHISQLI